MAMTDYLFVDFEWPRVKEHQRAQMKSEIEAIDETRLLNTSVDDLAKYFEDKFRIDVPELQTDDIVVDQHEVQIDVSQDQMRFIMDRSRPFHVSGVEVQVEIPFSGEASVFKIRPNPFNMNPPRARIRDSLVTFSISGVNLDATAVKRDINSVVSVIQDNLKSLRVNISELNKLLFGEAKTNIEGRRSRLLASKNLVASLGFKMKERGDSARTYTAPEVRKRLRSVMPSAGNTAFAPEPTLTDADYEHILTILTNMVHVMERSPSAFATLDEESLRTHFLVQLNGHYEGQATGETFNYEGRTDILIRSADRNIFIAECKFWSGPKKLLETIDQLLRYSAWRDTKTAIVIFSRQKDFSRVLAGIPEAVRSHPNYKRDQPGSTESVFRYVFANRDDRNRELLLTVLAFDVPSAEA